MRFMMIVRANKESESGAMPQPELLEAMGRFNKVMIQAGVMLAGDGLQPSSKGARVHFTKGKPTVIDGPYIESKELVGGYWMIQVRSQEDAIEWAKRAPMLDGDMIEVRKVQELSEFPDEIQKALGR